MPRNRALTNGGIIDSGFYDGTKIFLAVVGTGCESNDVKGIELAYTDLPLAAGDQIWWQDRMAYWTPKDGSRQDVAIERIGYSYSIKND